MDSLNGDPISLPSHISKPDHQLCGHIFGKGKTKFGVLKDNKTSRLLKPIIDIRGRREYEFYQNVWNSEDNELKSFVPKFYGLVNIEKIPFIQIEDATEGLANPSNMDIKIGIITYDPGADENKKQEEMSKNPWQEVNGFRISGARVYDPLKGENIIILDKNIAKKLRPEDITDALDLFLGSKFKTLIERTDLCEKYLSKLSSIKQWFDKRNINHLKFLSSSLLFVHSSDNQTALLKMIDFAHVFPNTPKTSEEPESKDENYLFGLNRLISYFDDLLSKLKVTTTNQA